MLGARDQPEVEIECPGGGKRGAAMVEQGDDGRAVVRQGLHQGPATGAADPGILHERQLQRSVGAARQVDGHQP